MYGLARIRNVSLCLTRREDDQNYHKAVHMNSRESCKSDVPVSSLAGRWSQWTLSLHAIFYVVAAPLSGTGHWTSPSKFVSFCGRTYVLKVLPLLEEHSSVYTCDYISTNGWSLKIHDKRIFFQSTDAWKQNYQREKVTRDQRSFRTKVSCAGFLIWWLCWRTMLRRDCISSVTANSTLAICYQAIYRMILDDLNIHTSPNEVVQWQY